MNKELIIDAIDQQPEAVRFLLDSYGIADPHTLETVADAAAEIGAPFIADLDDIILLPWLDAVEAGTPQVFDDFAGMFAGMAANMAASAGRSAASGAASSGRSRRSGRSGGGFGSRIRARRASRPPKEDRRAAKELKRQDRGGRRQLIAGTLVEAGSAAIDTRSSGGSWAETAASAGIGAASGALDSLAAPQAEYIPYLEAKASPGTDNRTLIIAGIAGIVMILAGLAYSASNNQTRRR